MMVEISIHAPHTGSDPTMGASSTMSIDFNPRSPYGERRRQLPMSAASTIFQSTLPIRGATNDEWAKNTALQFQSTLPIRGATTWHEYGYAALDISIHAPHTGSDYALFSTNPNDRKFQSTLPIRGATRAAGVSRAPPSHFNPRSPYGERLVRPVRHVGPDLFQSTLPIRGATWVCDRACEGQHISIHAPHTGSDRRERVV